LIEGLHDSQLQFGTGDLNTLPEKKTGNAHAFQDHQRPSPWLVISITWLHYP
jgi:hypothetical protein